MLHSSREPVLQRRAGERQAVICGDRLAGLGGGRAGVLDVLRLVEEHVAPAGLGQLVPVAAGQGVRGQDQIGACQVLHPLAAILSVPDEDPQPGGEALGLALPVGENAGRGDHQGRRGALGVARLLEQRQRLHRLSEPHVVGEDSAEAVAVEEPQPGESRLLVVPERGGEPLRGGHRRDARELLELGDGRPGAGLEPRALAQRGERIQRPGLVRRQLGPRLSGERAGLLEQVRGLGQLVAVGLGEAPVRQAG